MATSGAATARQNRDTLQQMACTQGVAGCGRPHTRRCTDLTQGEVATLLGMLNEAAGAAMLEVDCKGSKKQLAQRKMSLSADASSAVQIWGCCSLAPQQLCNIQ